MNAKHILVVNGSNLDIIGNRETGIYGHSSWEDIRKALQELADSENMKISFFQSNHEGELIDYLHQAGSSADLMIINPGGFTHFSVSLRDAVAATKLPVIEVHLSNIAAREPFRKTSLFSDIAVGTITGFQADSYYLALKAAVSFLNRSNP